MSDAAARPPAVVHVDLDGAADIFRVHGWPWRGGDDDPLFDRGLPALLDFLDAEGVRATLFAIARALERPDRLRRLREAVDRGHRIASHTITHRPLLSLSPAERRAEIGDSRKRIEDALGQPVDGFRAPDFAIDRATLEMVAEAGYAWDSSLLPGFRGQGFDAVPAVPHRALPDHDLLELPMPDASPLPVPFHPSYSLVLGPAWFRLGLARFRRTGAPLVLLFHLTDVGEGLPRSLTPSWRSRFFTLSWLSAAAKRRRCGSMLARVRRHYELVETPALVARCGAA